MHELLAVVDRVATGNASVLITGETGTGKELIARAIHARSLRASKPWVDVNCGALPEHLVESELFGYEKGAFSGADNSKPGLFELAHNGTFFLDEVGELEPKVQVKLLRVLDGVPYYRLGGSRKVNVNVRVIAATNRALEPAVKNGTFRQDLYHRLCHLQLRVPPLRERSEDLVALASHFLEQNCSGKQLSFGALDILRRYSWPGNVRELRNVVLQAALNARGAEIAPEDLPLEVPAANGVSTHQRTALESGPSVDLDQLEKQAITRALALTAGHQGLAAEQLGISRRTLSRKLKQFRIERRSVGNTDDVSVQVFRATVATPVHIVSRHCQQSATSVNISEGGIAVEGIRDPFQLAGALRVEFTIPGESQTFTAGAQIVWADVEGRAGFRFTQVGSDLRSTLTNWLRKKRSELLD